MITGTRAFEVSLDHFRASLGKQSPNHANKHSYSTHFLFTRSDEIHWKLKS